MRFPLGTSAETIREAPLLLIDLATDQGMTGRSYLFCYHDAAGPAIARVLAAAVDMVRSHLIAPHAVAAELQRRFRLIGVSGIVRMALSGLDVALWDALAKSAGLPLHAMLGATSRPVPAYNSNGLGLVAPSGHAEEAAALLDGGFQGLKLRLGRPAAGADLAIVRTVRKSLPDHVALMIDFNQALTKVEALALGRKLDDEGVYWIEEPIRHDDYAGTAELAKALRTPLQIGENFCGPQSMEIALQHNACDYAMPDLARIGGVTGWLQAAALAAAQGLAMSSHLFPEVSAQLLVTTPTAHWLEYVDWANPILREPLKIVDGHAHPSQADGVGLEWDDDMVARYRSDR
jgi:mandelate racemase